MSRKKRGCACELPSSVSQLGSSSPFSRCLCEVQPRKTFRAVCHCLVLHGSCPWAQIPTAFIHLSWGWAELGKGRIALPKVPVGRHRAAQQPLAPRHIVGENARAPRGTPLCWPKLCLGTDFVYGKDGAEGEILALPAEVPGSALPPASFHIQQQQLRARAAPGSLSEGCWEQRTLSPKALGSREGTGRTCSRPGNPCFLLQPGRRGQPQCFASLAPLPSPGVTRGGRAGAAGERDGGGCGTAIRKPAPLWFLQPRESRRRARPAPVMSVRPCQPGQRLLYPTRHP